MQPCECVFHSDNDKGTAGYKALCALGGGGRVGGRNEALLPPRRDRRVVVVVDVVAVSANTQAERQPTVNDVAVQCTHGGQTSRNTWSLIIGPDNDRIATINE